MNRSTTLYGSLLAYALAALALSACADETFARNEPVSESPEAGSGSVGGNLDCGPRTISFTHDVMPVLADRCVGCHSGDAPRGALNLEASHAVAAMVGIPTPQCADGRLLIDPGDVDNSYLIQKLTDTDLCAGKQMPPPSLMMPDMPRPLDDGEIDTISAWICQGAFEQ